MRFIYVFSRYLTFPAVFIRCLWEQIICRFGRIAVEDDRYVRDDEMCSHIEHEIINGRVNSFMICFMPFLSAVAGIAAFSVFPYIFRPTSLEGTICSGLSVWFVISFVSNCFPSIEDALNMKERIYKESHIAWKIILAPFFALLFVGAYLERYCITFIAALVLSYCIFLL